MTRLLHLRSIRAAIARGERRLADLDGKRTELMGSIKQLRDMLPEAARPDTHEQPQVELIKVTPPGYETTTGYEGTRDDPQAPQATDAEQASGIIGPAKVGWPKGLSRKFTTCENSPKWPAHRHRTEGTEVYCLDPLPQQAT